LVCAAEKDQISKELFEELLKDEEDHFNYFENVKDHLDKLGVATLPPSLGKKACCPHGNQIYSSPLAPYQKG